LSCVFLRTVNDLSFVKELFLFILDVYLCSECVTRVCGFFHVQSSFSDLLLFLIVADLDIVVCVFKILVFLVVYCDVETESAIRLVKVAFSWQVADIVLAVEINTKLVHHGVVVMFELTDFLFRAFCQDHAIHVVEPFDS